MTASGRPGLGQISRGCLGILLALLAMSLPFLMTKGEAQASIGQFAAASGHSLWSQGKLWQLLSSPFLEKEFVALLFQGFMLFMFLPSLEKWWGTKRFIRFFALSSVVGVLVGTLVVRLVPGLHPQTPITGLDPFIYASIVAYGTLFANQQVQFFGVLPLTGRQLTIGICGFMLVFVFLGQAYGEGAANISAMFLAWVLTNGKWTPKLWFLKRKQARLRKHLKVVRDDDEPKRYLN